jgi:hypothetical protein
VLVIRVFVIDNSKALEGMAPVKDTNSGLGGIALGSIVLVEAVYTMSPRTKRAISQRAPFQRRSTAIPGGPLQSIPYALFPYIG